MTPIAVRDFQIKKCPKTDAKILSLCTLCLCGSFLGIIYFLEVSYRSGMQYNLGRGNPAPTIVR